MNVASFLCIYKSSDSFDIHPFLYYEKHIRERQAARGRAPTSGIQLKMSIFAAKKGGCSLPRD